jgi:hypothetical protein
MTTLSRLGIAVFALAVVLGPIYTVADYSVVRNLISELGAQHTQNNFIMVIAFILLGAGIAIDGIKTFKLSFVPFILFGVTMANVGLFPHKPIDAALNYSSTLHNLHGILASVAGTFITIGFIWQGFLARGKQRMVCFYMALVAIVFPILMLNFPNLQGIVQRLMYLQILGWIWMKYPRSLVTSKY